jgi:hypothetical protein
MIIILSTLLAISIAGNVYLFIRNQIYKNVHFDMRMIEETRDLMQNYFKNIPQEQFEKDFEKVIENAKLGKKKN